MIDIRIGKAINMLILKQSPFLFIQKHYKPKRITKSLPQKI